MLHNIELITSILLFLSSEILAMTDATPANSLYEVILNYFKNKKQPP